MIRAVRHDSSAHSRVDRVLRLGAVRVCGAATLHCEAIAVMKSVLMPEAELYPLSMPLPEEVVPGPDGCGQSGSWSGNPLQACTRFEPAAVVPKGMHQGSVRGGQGQGMP